MPLYVDFDQDRTDYRQCGPTMRYEDYRVLAWECFADRFKRLPGAVLGGDEAEAVVLECWANGVLAYHCATRLSELFDVDVRLEVVDGADE